MAKSDQVKIRIALEGGPEIVQTLNALGVDGEKALKQLQKIGNIKADATQQSLRRVSEQLKTLGSQIDAVAKKFSSIGKSWSTKLTLPIVGAGAGILKQAADFEAATNELAANAAITGVQFDAAKEKAKELGQASIFSSMEAAKGMTELAKVGLDYQQIMGGAADAMVNLAAANGAGLEDSATVVGDILNQFKLNASQLPGLVDQITGATIESKMGFNDYMLAIGQAGGAAGALGVKFDEFNAVLAATSSSFSSGSDAGTSFKTFLTRLVPQSKDAAGMMEKLGLKFFDTSGNMKSMTEIAQELQDKLGNLSDYDLNDAVKTIFGVDALRTAIALMRQGGDGITTMMAKLKATDSAAIAAVRVKGLKGELDQLRSAIENLSISIGDSGLLGFMTSLVEKMTGWVQTLSQLNSETLSLGTKVGALVAAIGPLLIALGALGRGVGFVVRGFGDLIAAGILLRNAFLWFTPWGRALLIAGAAFSTFLAVLGLAKNKQYDAAAAATAHKDAINQLKAAQEAAKAGIPGAEEDLKKLAQAHLDTAKAALADANAALEHKKVVLEALQEQVDASPFAEFQKKFGTDLPTAMDEVVRAQGRVAQSTRELAEIEATIAGKSIDTDKAIRSVDNLGNAVANTAAKVEDAGRRITVTKFGADGMQKVTYELQNGVVTGAQQAGAAMDQLGAKGDAAGQKAATGLGAIRSVAKDADAAANEAADGISGAVSKSVDGISNVVTKSVDGIDAAVRKSVDGFDDAAGAAADGIDNDITNSISKIPTAADQAASQVSLAFGSIDYGMDAAGEQAQAATSAALEAITGIAATLSGFGGDVRGTFSAIASSIGKQFQALVSTVSTLISRLEAQLARLRAAIASAQAQAGSSGSGGGARGYAGGGSVHGAGTSQSDSILAWLSNGEFVVNARATAQWLPLLQAINGFRLTRDSLRKHLRGFNLGGFVDGIRTSLSMPDLKLGVPALASGGLAAASPAGPPVTLVLEGRTFDMSEPDVARKLGKYARERSMVSIGRRPTWNKG